MASRTEVQQALIAAHRSGDVATARRMAQALQMMDEWDAVPVAAPLGQVATPPKPTFSFRERANEFSAGVGKAWGQAVTDLTQQADKFGERYMQAVNDPTIGRIPFGPLARAGYGVVEDIAASIEPFVRNPAMVADIAQGMARQASTGPQGAGEVFGSLVSPGQVGKAFNRPVMQELTTYHGTPYVFSPEEGAPLGRFKPQQIGTGEGAQAYGYGLYLAESPGVAKGYREALSTYTTTIDGNPITAQDPRFSAAMQIAARGYKNALSDAESALASGFVDKDYAQRSVDQIKALKNAKISQVQGGSLYTVDLPDEKIERMLDWDKPLTEQPESVRRAFANAMKDAGVESYTTDGMRVYLGVGAEDGLRGRDVYNRIAQDSRDAAIQAGRNSETTLQASQADASSYLRALGVPGIKYLDAGSRGQGGSGTRNFVVFPGEETDVRILKRE